MINKTRVVSVLMALLMALSFLPGYAPMMAYADSEEKTTEQAAPEAAIELEEEEEAIEYIPEQEAADAQGAQAEEELAQEMPDERAPKRASKTDKLEAAAPDQFEEAEQEQPADEQAVEEAARPALRSLNATNQTETIPLTLKGGYSVPDVEYTPSETGYYEWALSARANNYSSGDGGSIDMWFQFFEDDKLIGRATLDESDYNGVPAVSLYMQKGKDYRIKITRHESSDATGALYVTKLAEEDVEEFFTVEDGNLAGYSGNLITVRIPEGVTNVSTEAYLAMSKNIDWGTISVHYPSTMEEGSITGRGLNYNTGLWDTRYSLAACRLVVSSECEAYKSIDGVVYSKDGTELVAVPKYYNSDELTIADGTKTIGECAFGWDGGIGTVILPDSLEVIKEEAFYMSSRLTDIEIGSNLKTIEEWAFDGTSVTTLDLPESLEEVHQYAFHGCDDLESVTFNSDVWLGYGAFNGCSNLKTIDINGNISAGGGTFEFCPSITEVNIGKKATEWELRDKSLVNSYEEDSEETVNLVLVLRDYDSEEFVIDDDIQNVFSEAFDGISGVKKLTIGKACRSLSIRTDLEEIAVNKGNKSYYTENGALYLKYNDYSYLPEVLDCVALVKFPMNSDVTELAVPDKVTEITDEAFAKYSDYNRKLKKVVFTANSALEDIGYGLFSFDSGWYDEEEQGPITLTIAASEDSPLYDYYLENYEDEYLAWETVADASYKVTFDPNGGTVSKKTVTRTKNAKIGTLPTPTKSGRTFAGWYTSKTGGSKISANTVVTKNVTYYARWQCTVKFNANGGKASKTSAKVVEGSAIGTLPNATKSGYFFMGWYTAKSGGSKINTGTKISGNKTFYARWVKAEIGNSKVSVKNTTWTGKARKPEVTVTFQGKTLKQGTDYTVTYSNNKEVGKKAKVTVKGKGTFAKSKKTKSAYFTIDKADQKISASNATYNAGTKGFKTIKITVKESAKITLASSDKEVITIPTKAADKKKGNIKIVGPGEVRITIKTAATKHYKAGKKTITVVVKGKTRPIKLTSSWLKATSDKSIYDMSKDVVNSLISVDVGDNTPYTVTIEESGAENEVWVEKGNLLTAKGKGNFRIKVVVKASKAFPAATAYFTIRKSGWAVEGVQYQYRQTAAGNVDILKYVGNKSARSLIIGPTLKIAGKNRKITRVSDNAFANCEIAKMTFKDPSSGTGITYIGKNAIANNKALSLLRLPSGLETIGDGAFKNCSNLVHLRLPSSIKTIGSSAFEGCMSLQDTLWLPKSLETIGASAFKGCIAIPRVAFGSFIKTVGANAFSGDTGIEKVCYAAAKTRWNQINFGAGNEPVTSIEPLCNVGASIAAYEVTGISTDTLLREAPEYLYNPSYEYLTGELMEAVSHELYKRTDKQMVWSALKTEMMKGPAYCVKKIIQDAEDYDVDEINLRKEMALELIVEVANETAAEEAKKEYTEKYHAVYDALDEFKGLGDKVFADNETRWKVAQSLDGLFPGRQASEFNDMLKAIQEYWKHDDEHPMRLNVEDVFAGAGRSIDAADFVFEVLMLNEYYKVYIDSIMPYLEEGSDLYIGFSELKTQMDQPLAAYVAGILQEEVLSGMTKMVISASDEAFGFDGGAVKVATIMYQIAGYMMDVPTIDEYNKAWISMTNAMSLGTVHNNVNRKLVENKGGDISGLSKDHAIITSLYLKAIEKAGDYCCSTMKDPQSVKELFENYKSGLNYAAYIASCKQNLVDSK